MSEWIFLFVLKLEVQQCTVDQVHQKQFSSQSKARASSSIIHSLARHEEKEVFLLLGDMKRYSGKEDLEVWYKKNAQKHLFASSCHQHPEHLQLLQSFLRSESDKVGSMGQLFSP